MISAEGKWKVWWIEPMPQVWREGKEMLERNKCEVIMGRPQTEADKPYSEDEIIEGGKGIDAILLIARERITSRVLDGLRDLRIVVKAGIGVDNIDVQAATRNGILVANTPVPADYMGVAEGTVARLLALAKRLAACDRAVKEKKWLGEYEGVKGVYMRGKTVGILGLGRIGSYIARLMKPWGVRVIAHDPYVLEERAELLDVELVDMNALLRGADFLSVNAILSPETRHIIDEGALRKMKRTAFIINTARGPIIEEGALHRALKEGWIAGAALDVFSEEPPRASPLLDPEIADRLILSPHVSGLSEEMERGLTMAQVRCCMVAMQGEPPNSTLNREAVEKWRKRFRTGV
jgi:D-3-phosphoglycerate dehydrogenase